MPRNKQVAKHMALDYEELEELTLNNRGIPGTELGLKYGIDKSTASELWRGVRMGMLNEYDDGEYGLAAKKMYDDNIVESTGKISNKQLGKNYHIDGGAAKNILLGLQAAKLSERITQADANIPDGITSDLIRKAVDDFNSGTVQHKFKNSTKFDVIIDGNRYPPKAIIGLASCYLGANLTPAHFSAGFDKKCFRILLENNFPIVPKPEDIISDIPSYDIINQIKEFAREYENDRINYNTANTNNPSWNRLVIDLPNTLNKLVYLHNSYKVAGSIGNGNLAEVPWICFFDQDITKSATKGYYIVLLFRSDMQGFYLSLNQGWTQYQEEYGTTKGKKYVVENATKAVNTLRSLSKDFITGPIDLKATKTLAKGYEAGNICSKYFDLSSDIDDEKFINELLSLVVIYKELKGLVGTNILDISSISSEDDYQNEVQKATSNYDLKDGPVELPDQSASTITNRYKRNASIAKKVIEDTNYKCAFDSEHTSFTSAATNQQYMEAHHIVPMEYQNDYPYSLDVPENIVCICPNCHTMIHRSVFSEKEEILTAIYAKRHEKLKGRGISIDLDTLKKYYK